jgi:hypothetical protein
MTGAVVEVELVEEAPPDDPECSSLAASDSVTTWVWGWMISSARLDLAPAGVRLAVDDER